jgi:hypothetical protein
MLHTYCFGDNASASQKEFWRRFRMKKELFMKLLHGVIHMMTIS